jgi:hypothetical protein
VPALRFVERATELGQLAMPADEHAPPRCVLQASSERILSRTSEACNLCDDTSGSHDESVEQPLENS